MVRTDCSLSFPRVTYPVSVANGEEPELSSNERSGARVKRESETGESSVVAVARLWLLWLMTGSLHLGKSRDSRTRKEIGELTRRLLFRKREFTIRHFMQKDKGTVCFAVDCSEGILVQQMG